MQIDEEEEEVINIEAIDVEQLLLEAKTWIEGNALLVEDFEAIRKQLSSRRIVDRADDIWDKLLCWKNQIDVPEGIRKRIMESEHDSKVAGHFGRETTMELIIRNFRWPNVEMDIWNCCNDLRQLPEDDGAPTCKARIVTSVRDGFQTMDAY